MESKAREIEETMLGMRDEKRAAGMMRFFKTGPGEYGHDDHFLGIPNPGVRTLVKLSWKDVSLDEAAELATNRWHEIRLCGLLIMVEHMLRALKRRDHALADSICERYLSLHPYINNWDLVDLSAIKIVGEWELLHPDNDLMDRWAELPDDCLWQRRIAMVACWRTLRHGDHETVCSRAALMMDSRHDLLHKAAGWMLRELWKHGGEERVEMFLEANACRMPSVMLSYTCEKMSPQQREYWREKRKSPSGK